MHPFQCCLKPESFKLQPEKRGFRFIPIDWETKSIRLLAGRGDWAAFQIVMKDGGDYAVNAGREPYFSQALHRTVLRAEAAWSTPSAPPVTLRLIGALPDDDGFPKGDILLQQDVMECAAEEPSALWAEIRTGADTPPGLYEGCVRLYRSHMFETETLLETLPFTLEVIDYRMPVPGEYRFHLDLWQHLSNIARKHDVRLWSEEHFQVLEPYVRSLAALGQKAVTVLASQVPWRGQSCFYEQRTPANLFEYSPIAVYRQADGSFTHDFTAMQTYIDLCFRYGIDKEIELFGITSIWTDERAGFTRLAPDYPDAMKVRYLDRATGLYGYMDTAADLIGYVRAIEAYFIGRGLIDRVRVVADEPQDHDDLRKSLRLLREIAPSFRFKAAINQAAMVEEFSGDIDDFVPYLSCVAYEWPRLDGYRRQWPDKRFLWYVCLSPPYLNTLLSSGLLEGRLIGILTSYMRFAGFLRWNYTVWGADPRRDVRYAAFPAGDTNFVYPAYNGSVLLSLRYYALKRGIEDYELLERYRSLYGDERTDALISLVLRQPDMARYAVRDTHENITAGDLLSQDPDDYNRLRRLLLEGLCHENTINEGWNPQ